MESDLKSPDLEGTLELQEGLSALLDRVEGVQADHAKLSSEKKLLEDYIGNLMVSLI